MLQITQSLRTGKLRVADLPEPIARPGHVLIANSRSVISAGTEKTAIELARKSLLGKAMERPDHVRRALEKMRNEGILTTIEQVFNKLDETVGLGYSSAGIVLATGTGVQGFRPGDRVASNGPHAGVVSVPKHLCALVPHGVPLEDAAYGVLGAIALQGIRLSHAGLGDTVLVIGLGLIGQLATALLTAAGCQVVGSDPDSWKCDLALRMGAKVASPQIAPRDILSLTQGLGADAVLITASTKSDAPVELAAEAVRKKGRVVVVGSVGMNVPRRPFYFKEAEIVVSCSYGPGRYDPEYEERGHDYPAGYVRWTEERNLQGVLNLMASGNVDLKALTMHRFPIERAEQAYQLIESGNERYLGIVLEYPEVDRTTRCQRIERQISSPRGAVGIGVVGAGDHARSVLLPALQKSGSFRTRIICAAGGLAVGQAADKSDFEVATTDEEQVYSDPHTQAIFILTRHDLHAGQVLKAIRAGKHVFVEKPLALQLAQISDIDAALHTSSSILLVGFNRRFSPAAKVVREFFSDVREPLTISIRFNAGAIAPDHWTQSAEIGGGRLIGEGCHAVDLATFIAGSEPVRVFAESIGGLHSPAVTNDQSFLTLRHASGSISSIGYLAGGDKSFSKERVEVLGGGRIAVIDDFREVTTSVKGKVKHYKNWNQDKGHHAEIEAFARSLLQGGPSPIPWHELRAVSLACILADQSLREGVPFQIP